jgi:hypothetical protein
VPLAGIFFLEQAERDRVAPIEKSRAVALITDSSKRMFYKNWVVDCPKSPIHEMLFENTCHAVRRIPVFTLETALNGDFCSKIERALKNA